MVFKHLYSAPQQPWGQQTCFWTPAELKNCKLENPSLLFGPLAQYLGSNGFIYCRFTS